MANQLKAIEETRKCRLEARLEEDPIRDEKFCIAIETDDLQARREWLRELREQLGHSALLLQQAVGEIDVRGVHALLKC